jgi:hypothetical protein
MAFSTPCYSDIYPFTIKPFNIASPSLHPRKIYDLSPQFLLGEVEGSVKPKKQIGENDGSGSKELTAQIIFHQTLSLLPGSVQSHSKAEIDPQRKRKLLRSLGATTP